VGSSIVKRAFPAARDYPGGSNLGLTARIWWQGYSGLSLRRTKDKLTTLLKLESPPDIIVLHIGGNDLGNAPVKSLSTTVDLLYHFIDECMPGTKIVWSEVLPRAWGQENKGLFSARRRLNCLASKFVKQRGGFYLPHVNLRHVDNKYFLPDGIHLNDQGTGIFLGNIAYGMKHFLKGIQPWF
jgi:lysophospholipase L1-like esterase